ncbi:hypothetical protein [Hydrogenophaga sp.]|uniref:hypothetical protein n=1 Tax=Hydrogenophaga sp. TaxID=1904254 RepID=UPI00286DC07D|nr:hypothetical protein [Hydrogenophaga sp.]
MHTRPTTRTLQPRAAAPSHELVAEHGVLMRQIGGLQRRSSELLRASSARETALVAENLRLRAELVLLRTSVFWGLGAATVLRRPVAARPPAVDAGAREAQAVICQTGCVGHAHPWLEADGQCRRSGQACERVDPGAAVR